MTEKRLYKARGQRMVCGVCGGVAEYFGIDIVAAIIIPEPPADPYR